MLWIALHLPRLSLDLIERARPGDNDTPNTAAIAICNHLQILSANQAALNGGVTPGSRRASAQALLPEIELLPHDPVREQQALTTLACWALQFTPSVAFAPAPLPERQALRRASSKPDNPDDAPGASQQVAAPLPAPGEAGLLLEIAPSLKLFGGLAALLEQLLQGLQQLGYHANLGIAGTCHGAWLLALSQPMRTPQGEAIVRLPTRRRAGQGHPGRAPDPVSAMQASDQPTDHATLSTQSLEHMQDPDTLMQRLSPLPLSLLRHASTHLSALRTIGAHTIGDLLELPRAGLARRFGKKLLLEVDAALGAHPQPIGFFNAPEQFSAKLELMADVERTEPLLYAGRRLIFELAGWLAARQAGVRSFDLILEHNTPPVTALSVRLTNASRDPLRLIGLLRERLNILQLRTSVHTIHLRCSRVQSLAQASQTLFDSPASTHESLGRLLERLQVRLGREQVQRLHLAQDHRPEAAYEIRVIDKLDDLGKLTSQTKSTAARAARTEPNTDTEQHDQFKTIAGELFCASTGTLPRPLWLLRDPSPLAERNNRPWLNSVLTVLAGPERIETGWWDTRLIQRDYFVAEDDTNTLYWIFRERHKGWFVHGKFG